MAEHDDPSDDPVTHVGELRRFTRFTRRWYTWIGESDDLVRLGLEGEKLFKKRQQQVDSVAVEDSMKAWSALLRLKKPPAFEMTIRDGPDRISGPIDAVMMELDRRTVDAITFAGSISDNDTLSVSLYRNPRENAVVELKVEAESAGWARETLAHLSEQIDRAQPEWSWWHKKKGAMTLGLFNLALLSIPPLVLLTLKIDWATILPVVPLYSILALFVAFGAARPLLRRLLPPFEVTSVGAPSKGSRVIAYIGTAFVGFVGSLIAAIVTSL